MRNAPSPPFAVLLRPHRRTAEMTQEELAERAGVSVRALSEFERGVRVPRKDTLGMLVDALQLGPQEQARLMAAAREGGLSPDQPRHSKGPIKRCPPGNGPAPSGAAPS